MLGVEVSEEYVWSSMNGLCAGGGVEIEDWRLLESWLMEQINSSNSNSSSGGGGGRRQTDPMWEVLDQGKDHK